MASYPPLDKLRKDASKIHAICVDRGLADNEAKLMTYIHSKVLTHERGLQCFEKPEPEEVAALEIMLGRFSDLPPELAQVAQGIREIDSVAHAELGIEFPLRYELEARLRLYQDATFRHAKTTLYRSTILPLLHEYDDAKITAAFKKRQLQIQQVRQRLTRLDSDSH